MFSRAEKRLKGRAGSFAGAARQHKEDNRQTVGFVDNRNKSKTQKRIQTMADDQSEDRTYPLFNSVIKEYQLLPDLGKQPIQCVAMTWQDFPTLNDPKTGSSVVAPGSGDAIAATVGTEEKSVRFGQSFLNTGKSREYKENPDTIKTDGVEIRPRLVQGDEQEGEMHVSDGHHRAIWCGYHGKTINAEIKRGFSTGASIKNMTYKELEK